VNSNQDVDTNAELAEKKKKTSKGVGFG